MCPIGEELRRVFLQASIALTNIELASTQNSSSTPLLTELLHEANKLRERAIDNLARHIEVCPPCRKQDCNSRIH